MNRLHRKTSVKRCAMNMIKPLHQSRRLYLRSAAAITIGLVVGVLPLVVRAASDAPKTLKIGIVGSGRIGGTLGELWVKAGHQVMFSSLDIEHDKALAARLERRARRHAERSGRVRRCRA